MFKCTKLGVKIIPFVISIVIFILIDLFIFKQNYAFLSGFYSNIISENNILFSNIENLKENLIIENDIEKTSDIKQEKKNNEQTGVIWQISIPSINLNAEIREGTTDEVLNKYVGHFEMTSKKEGNIGLAAHNRGYEVNFFHDLKKLKEDDEIIYKYQDFKKIYIVKEHKIIKDTDWSILEEIDENILTLITCVENEPQYRRCIIAIEKE